MTQTTSTPSAVSAAVRALVAQNFGISRERVVGSAALVADLGATSLDSVELVMAIEDAFEIEISDDHAATVVTIDDLEQLILRLQATQRRSIAA
jgi:acyl carrier protein